MEVSTNRKLNMLLHFIGNKKLEIMELFVAEILQSECVTFTSEEEILDFFTEILQQADQQNKKEEFTHFKNYSGLSFSNVNAILRENWQYEINGKLTKEKEEICYKMADVMSNSIRRLPELPNNIKVYRGVPLEVFKNYGVSNLEDLLTLQGQYFYDSGFTSTSLVKENSYFDKQLKNSLKCNIEIEYCIPKESNDGFPLIRSDLSYSLNQTEYLLNKGNLSKIVTVQIDEERKTGHIKMVLLPEKIWNYSCELESDRQK